MTLNTRWRILAVGALLGAAALTPACSSDEGGAPKTKQQNLTADAWSAGHSYQAGDLVEYDGKIYRAIQGHTALHGWEPPNVAALWEFVGMDDGGAPPTTPDPVDELTLEYVAGKADCDAAPETCCAPGSNVHELSTSDDTYYSVSPEQCVLAGLGRDTIFLQSSGPSSLILGEGDDTAMDGAGDDLIWGGFGRDTINGYGGTNLFFGGWGDDVIMAANGTNTVVPGPGLDTVNMGTGDDTAHIFDLCEIEPGEQINGGTGFNTLYTPVPLDELTALGVSIVNFQKIVVVEQPCLSQCADHTGCGPCFIDSDSDGVNDCQDECRVDPDKSKPGNCGCHQSEDDDDGDGYENCIDECPNDPESAKKGDCGCPSNPEAVGTACFDAVCPGQQSCTADGQCGDPETCSPVLGQCELRYFSKYDRYYWFCDVPKTWDEARDLCGASRDRKIAYLGAEDINTFASDYVEGTMWMGANAKATPGNWYWRSFSTDSGDLMWTGGEDGESYFARYNAWSAGAPSDAGQCGYVNSSGNWVSADCTQSHGFICEVHPQRLGGGENEGGDHDRPCEILGIPCEPWRPDPTTCVDDPNLSSQETATLEQLAECEKACLDFGNDSDQCANACVGSALPPTGEHCNDGGIQLIANSLSECNGLIEGLPEADRASATCVVESCGRGTAAPGSTTCSSSADCGIVQVQPLKPCNLPFSGGDGSPRCDEDAGEVCDGFFCGRPTVCSDQYDSAVPGDPRKCVLPPAGCDSLEEVPALCDVVELCEPEIDETLEEEVVPESNLGHEEITPDNTFAEPHAAPENELYLTEDDPCSGSCVGVDSNGNPNGKGQAHPWCELGTNPDDDLPDQPNALPEKDGASDNGLVRFNFDPKFEFTHNAEIGAFGVPDVDVVAIAGVTADASLGFAGNPTFTIVDVNANLLGTECGVDGDATLSILGADFIDDVAGEVPVPFHFPDEEASATCSKLLSDFQDVANRAKKALRDAIELKRQYAALIEDDVFDEVTGEWQDTLGNNFAENFCELLGEKAPRGFPQGTCVVDGWETPEDTINHAIDYYLRSINGFGINGIEGINEVLARLEQELTKAAEGFAIDKNITFVDFNRTLEETLLATQFFIGPIPCFLEVLATADFGVEIGAKLRLDPSKAVTHLFRTGEVAPRSIAFAGVNGVPHAGAGIGIYSGVGFGVPGFKVQLGIRGDLSIAQIYIPAYVGAGIGVGSTPDVRDVNVPADIIAFADADTLLIPPKKIVVDLTYQAGLAVNIRDILSGEISAQLKLKIAFFSKTWRKTLLRFSGLCGTNRDEDYDSLTPMAGCDFPIFEAGGSLTAGIQPPIPWGEIRMPMTFPGVPKLLDEHPTTPIGGARAALDRTEEFFYDSLCTCIDEAAEEEGRECFRNDDCCVEDFVCFDDQQSDAPNKCIKCQEFEMNCNEDSDCCSNLCVSGTCSVTQCGQPCTRDVECAGGALCLPYVEDDPNSERICLRFHSPIDPCTSIE